jgi:hypothetical protein
MPNPEVLQFDHYPDLRELGFTNGGVPGIEYAYVHADDMRKAQADGFGPVLGGAGGFFTVAGARGEIDLQVWGRGRPIHGLDTNQLQPEIFVSDRAEQATGLTRTQVVDVEESTSGERKTESQGGKGDARVQKGNSA